MLAVLVEHALFVRDSNQHNDAEVDLHEDQELIKAEEDGTFNRLGDPLVAAAAYEVLRDSLTVRLPIHDEAADGNYGD